MCDLVIQMVMIKLVIQIGNEKTRQKGNEAIRQIRQQGKGKRAKGKTDVSMKQRTPKFSEKRTFLTP